MFAGETPSADELWNHYASYPASGDLSELTAQRYRGLLKQLEPFRQTGRLLDVGRGDGDFLITARDHGWDVFGSEYEDGPLQRAREAGLDVWPAPFPAAQRELASFDVVTAIEVVEHTTEPRVEAERIRALLRDGGCLYLATPKFDSLTRMIAGPGWRVIEYSEHLTIFTKRTLDRLLAAAGLSKLWMRTTGISPSDIRAGVSARKAIEPTPNFDTRLRDQVAASPMLDRGVRAVNAALSTLGVGETIKALYVR